MKYVRGLAVVLFILCLAAYIGSYIWDLKMTDHSYPEIKSETEELSLHVKDGKAKILDQLTAHDEKDGDLTDHIFLEHVSKIDENGDCEATYVVFDQDNHSTEFSRRVHFDGYCPPHFSVKQPLVFEVGSNFKFLDYVSAKDVIDGDISDKIRLKSSNIDSTTEGIYPVKIEVTDNYGSTSSLNLNIIVCSSQINRPKLVLSDYVVYQKKNANYDVFKYIDRATDSNGRVVDPDDIHIIGHVNTKKVGTYQILFLIDEEEVAYQTVVVE